MHDDLALREREEPRDERGEEEPVYEDADGKPGSEVVRGRGMDEGPDSGDD